MGWHRDDEPLFGECGDAKLIVSVSLGSSAVSDGGVSPVRMIKDTCAALAMVTFLSWMANVRTSSLIVRILAGKTGERCWPLLAGVWRAIAPLLKPLCA